MKHKIALVDDHELMRSGLAAMINGLNGYSVCLEASNGKEFIKLLDHLNTPAIAVVDLHMPVMDGYETIAWIVKNRPEIRTLALTFDATEDAMVKAIRMGARGFILKNARPALLEQALDSLMLTGYYHSGPVHKAMLSDAGFKTVAEREHDMAIEKATTREMEFLVLVCSAKELTYEEIAKVMGVHRRTVDNYRNNLFAKFKIKSKSGLVLFALRHGLVEND